jgi:hypothetical protein
MSKKISTVLALLVILLVITSTVYADKNQYDITISKPGAAWQIAPCPAPGSFGDTWRFINASAAVAIKVKVWNKSTNNITTYDIPASGNVIHTIAVGDCEILVYDNTGAQELTKCTGAYCGTTPTLTQWGIFALIALLVGSTVFIMLKRRKTIITA